MTEISLKFGKETLQMQLRDEILTGVLEGSFPPSPTPAEEQKTIVDSLRNPINSKPLAKIVQPGQKVVIMCSDITRPVPSYKILPALLNECNAGGIQDKDITIMFGMGIHRKHTKEEQKHLVGEEVFNRVNCHDSTEDEYVLVGTSSQGTPYWVNKLVTEADILICTGNIEYHWFVGYSGGAKAVLPGACNYETIKHNHAMILKEGTGTGCLEGNPVRADIDEILNFMPIHFIVNVVLDDKKQILKSFAGHPINAHRAGCAYLDGIYGKEISQKADVVIASCAGHPKDINVYQAQKALDNAFRAVKKGGTIILVASCKEGFGEKTFEEWVRAAESPQAIRDRLARDFQLGGHKAAGFAKVLLEAKVVMITDMPAEDVKAMFIEPHTKDELQAVIDRETAQAKSVYVIPQGGSVLPKIK